MRTRPRTGLLAALSVIALGSVSDGTTAAEPSSDKADPLPWGMLSHNAGCVIFKEYRKTKIRFYVIAATAKTISRLDVVEMQNVSLGKTTWDETQDSLDELQRLALKDNIKFVKLPEKYTDAQLAKAREMCRNAPDVSESTHTTTDGSRRGSVCGRSSAHVYRATTFSNDKIQGQYLGNETLVSPIDQL